MKNSNYKPMFLGAFAGLLVASFFLVFIESGDMDDWVRATLFAVCAWIGLRIASLLASIKKKENQE
jgi:hypothetical protein